MDLDVPICSLEAKWGDWAGLMPRCDVLQGLPGLIVDTLRRLAAQQMAARHEQIGQRAGDEQAMGVLLQPAIAQLGKAEHPLDDADRMFDPGPHFGLVRFFLRSTSSTTPR